MVNDSDNEFLVSQGVCKWTRDVQTDLGPAISRFGHLNFSDLGWGRGLFTHLASRALTNQLVNLCTESRPPVGLPDQASHACDAWVSCMCQTRDPFAKPNRGYELTVADQTVLLQVELILNVVVGQQISRDLSLWWPHHSDKLNYSGQGLIGGCSCLNLCEGEPLPCDAVQCDVPADLR